MEKLDKELENMLRQFEAEERLMDKVLAQLKVKLKPGHVEVVGLPWVK